MHSIFSHFLKHCRFLYLLQRFMYCSWPNRNSIDQMSKPCSYKNYQTPIGFVDMQLLMPYVAHTTLILTVEEVADSSVSEYSQTIEAHGLLHQIKSFSFLLSLFMFDKVFTQLSDNLQSSSIDLSHATELPKAYLRTIGLIYTGIRFMTMLLEKLRTMISQLKYPEDIGRLHQLD